MVHLIVKTYEEASEAIKKLGILPLSKGIPDHPSLDSITEPDAWHTGAETDPWQWRARLPSEGVAAYGRFIGSRPVLIAQDVFPLVKCVLTPSRTVQRRYSDGLLARSTVQIYEIIKQNHSIEVRELRKLSGMRDKADKNAFDHALIDLQNTADIVIAGATENLNRQGKKSGWNGTCYMLAERWMEEHGIELLPLTPSEARTQLFAQLKPYWEENAILYLQKKFDTFSS